MALSDAHGVFSGPFRHAGPVGGEKKLRREGLFLKTQQKHAPNAHFIIWYPRYFLNHRRAAFQSGVAYPSSPVGSRPCAWACAAGPLREPGEATPWLRTPPAGRLPPARPEHLTSAKPLPRRVDDGPCGPERSNRTDPNI